jgi:hypothetical protein
VVRVIVAGVHRQRVPYTEASMHRRAVLEGRHRAVASLERWGERG